MVTDDPAAAAHESGLDAEQEFDVEYIVHWRLEQRRQGTAENDPDYDATLGEWRWELCFRVKWIGYDQEEHYEVVGKRGFAEWLAAYDQRVVELMKLDPELKHPDDIEREAISLNDIERRNRAARKKQKAEAKALAKLQAKPKKQQRANPDSRGSSRHATGTPATNSRSPSLSGPPPVKGRKTMNSESAAWLQKELAEAPRGTRELAQLLEPERDETGKLLDNGLRSSSEEEGMESGMEDVKPNLEDQFASEPQTHFTEGRSRKRSRSSSQDVESGRSNSKRSEQHPPTANSPAPVRQRFADSSDEEEAPAPVAPAQVSHHFADSSDEEEEAVAPVAPALTKHHFADSSDEEEEVIAPVAPALISHHYADASPQRFADSSDEEEAAVLVAAAQTSHHFADSSDEEEVAVPVAPAIIKHRFADSSDEEEEAPAPAAPTLVKHHFADSSDEDEERTHPTASTSNLLSHANDLNASHRDPQTISTPLRFAESPDSEPDVVVQHPMDVDPQQAPGTPMHFADDSGSDGAEDDAGGVPVRGDGGRPAEGEAAPVCGFADSEDEEEQEEQQITQPGPSTAPVEIKAAPIPSRPPSSNQPRPSFPPKSNPTQKAPVARRVAPGPSRSSTTAVRSHPYRQPIPSASAASRKTGALPSNTLNALHSLSIRRVSNPVPAPAPSVASPPVASTSKAIVAPNRLAHSPAFSPPPLSPLISSMGEHSIDPRLARNRRPSGIPTEFEGSPPLATSAKSSTSTSDSKAVDHNLFNNGVKRPSIVNGQVVLNADILLRGFKTLPQYPDLLHRLRDVPSGADASTKIYALWDIKDWADNFVDWKGTMLKGPDGRPRQCFVWPPVTTKGIKNVEERIIERDVVYLQLLLANLKGVTQVDRLQPSVNAVFIHATQENQIGKPGGNLGELEALRSRKDGDTMFVIFGMKEKDGAPVFKEFWRVGGAICFTPSTYFEHHQQVGAALQRVSQSQPPFIIQRNLTIWSSVYLCSSKGPLYLVNGLREKLKRKKAQQTDGFLVFQKGVADKEIRLLRRPDTPAISSFFPVFPDSSDEWPIADRLVEEIDAALSCFSCSDESLQMAMLATVEALQDFILVLRMRYLMVRRWIVVGTDEEVEAASHVSGVDLMTMDQFQTYLDEALA